MHQKNTHKTRRNLKHRKKVTSKNPRHRQRAAPKQTPGSKPGKKPAPRPATSSRGAFLGLIEPLRRAVQDAGYTSPSPIQEQAIPHLLKKRDMFGCAQTGTGKTAAFTLPILQYFAQNERTVKTGQPRALILAPTRELAAQIGESISTYGRHLPIKHVVIFGGVSQVPQVRKLNRGVEIVVATPGRLLDLMQQKHVDIGRVEVFVLDEADRMLEMGFIPDIKKILAKLPRKRQSLFFSATMGKDIVALARTMVKDPVHITITPDQPAVEKIVQKVMFVEKSDKIDLLHKIFRDPAIRKALVFTDMKHVANKVSSKLNKAGIAAAAIHGNKSQGARTRALDDFKNGKVRVLVATDIAARGIDVDGITHVINHSLPNEPETYIHRIGRTARADADGTAISFCSPRERDYLKDIEKLLKQKVPQFNEHEFHSEKARTAAGPDARPEPRGGQRNKRNPRRPSTRRAAGRGKPRRTRRARS